MDLEIISFSQITIPWSRSTLTRDILPIHWIYKYTDISVMSLNQPKYIDDIIVSLPGVLSYCCLSSHSVVYQYILCTALHTYESLLLQVGQVSQCVQISLVSVVPPVELHTVQTVHLHAAHGALQCLLHHLRHAHTDTLQPLFLVSTVKLTLAL